jgi:hypothetical protein
MPFQITFDDSGFVFANVDGHVGRKKENNRLDVLLVSAMFATIFDASALFQSPLESGVVITHIFNDEIRKLILHFQTNIQHRSFRDGFISPARPERGLGTLGALDRWTIITMNVAASKSLEASGSSESLISLLRRNFAELAGPLSGVVFGPP